MYFNSGSICILGILLYLDFKRNMKVIKFGSRNIRGVVSVMKNIVW